MALELLTAILIAFTLPLIAYRMHLNRKFYSKARALDCRRAPRYKHKDRLFGLDIFLRTGKAISEHRFLEEHQHRYHVYGHTFEALNFGTQVIYSVHPDNIETVWSKNAADWGIQPLRLGNMQPFCGTGFITSDGLDWKFTHYLLKPSFHKSKIFDLSFLERHLQLMFSHVPKNGVKFDFQDLVFNMYLDLNTLFLFGEPIGILCGSPPSHAKGFLEAFAEGFRGCGMRIALGPLKHLLPTKKWLIACKKTHEFAGVYVEKAIEYRDKYVNGDETHLSKLEKQTERRTLLYNMATRTGDKTILRNQTIQTMMASTETTASLISTIVFLLAKKPTILEKLREQIDKVGHESLLHPRELLRIGYLQNIISKAFRLYPVFPQNNRVALKDTVLPVGGGPDRESPIFAPKGSLFDTCFATLHRNKEIWGSDADEFLPERWNTFSPSQFEYMPFGAGSRKCLAQQKVILETSYIIMRLLQTYQHIKSEDDRPWQGQVVLTAKNANGCLISLTSVW